MGLSSIQNFLEKYFLFIKKYIPVGPQESTIGLDIGTRYCKAVEVARIKNGFKVINWATEPVQEKDPLSAIKNLLKKLGSDSKDVLTGLSGQGTLIRFIKMPRMPITQLKDSLLIESDKYFPFPSSEIYIDCQIIDDGKIKDNKMSVLVAVAKKDLVKDRLQLISGLGLQSNFVGINAIAMANAVNECQKESRASTVLVEGKPEAVAFLDLGESKTTVIIFRENNPRFTREISIGGKDFTQKIMSSLGLDFPSAEKVKCFSGDQHADVMKAYQSIWMNLASEIRLSFDYFSSEDGSRVSKILLTGQNSRIDGIKDFLSKELEVAVQSWAPEAGLEFTEQANQQEFLKQADQLCVALGLALTKND